MSLPFYLTEKEREMKNYLNEELTLVSLLTDIKRGMSGRGGYRQYRRYRKHPMFNPKQRRIIQRLHSTVKRLK